MNTTDTIIALSTPPGHGAIGVIRLSGKDSIGIVDRFFVGKQLAKQEGNTLHFGKIRDEYENVLDECVVSLFKAPHSYTKEDVVEISCHGSPYILEQVIQLFLRQGVRSADRGEFTFRAFVNGQLDLAQAEAVADLIASDSEYSHRMSMQQMRGGFSREIQDLRQELIDFAALIELELDFGEEDVEFADRQKLENLIVKLQKVIGDLIDSFRLGNVIKNGVSTVIAGRPNAGKSTLLNALLNEERAIVSEIAGTTRDTIEESLNINGIQFRLVDTAGIREARDSIEQIGVHKTMEKIGLSTIVVYVFDIQKTSPQDLWDDVDQFLKKDDGSHVSGVKHLFIANKMDLNPYTKPDNYYKNDLINAHNLITTSAIHGMNIPYLKDKLFDIIIDNPSLLDKSIVSNHRHYDALYHSQEALQVALDGLRGGITGDFVAMDIRRALHHLGLITGEISSDDLLESIFTRFCIGK